MGKLFAAVSVRDITPTPDELALINQDGYYNYDGIKRRLFLKTLVLTDGQERFVYFGTDLSNFTLNEEAQQLFMEKLGLAPKDYMVGTNRSHNTVSSWGLIFTISAGPALRAMAEGLSILWLKRLQKP